MTGLGIGSLVDGAAKIIDELKTTPEERVAARAALLQVENAVTEKVLAYETALDAARRDIIVAEAKSDSWITRSWRPILMLVITAILAHKYILFPYLSMWLQVPELDLPAELFTLLTIAVGGYIAGRSGQAIVRDLRGVRATNADLPSDVRAAGRERRKMMKLAAKHGWSLTDLAGAQGPGQAND